MNTLFLRFGSEENSFAMGTSVIEEILPALLWTTVPHAPKGVVGVFCYHGQQIPLLDLSELMSGKNTILRMSTRIILIRHPQSGQLFGLLAEHVTETFRASEQQFKESGIGNAAAPYLRRIIQRGDEILQHLDVNRLLDNEFAEGLFSIDSSVHH